VRGRLDRAWPKLPAAKAVVLTSPDGVLARLAAAEAAALAKVPVRVLLGGTRGWQAAGFALETGEQRLADAATDVWYRPYDRHQGVEEAMKGISAGRSTSSRRSSATATRASASSRAAERGRKARWTSSSCSRAQTRRSRTASSWSSRSPISGSPHVGFKDVGVPPATLRALTAAIKRSGATSWMEVVSTSREATLASARTAAEIGIDRLLGGTDAEAILPIVRPSGVAYLPFAGRPAGHPTKLGGSPDVVAADCGASSTAAAPASTCSPIARRRQSRRR
jgi:hypothetical protein